MDTVIIVCSILLTVAIVITVVFLVQLLIQVRRTAAEAETLLKNTNDEMAKVKQITENISSVSQKFVSPMIKVGGLMAAVSTFFVKSKIFNKCTSKKAGDAKNNAKEEV